MIHPRFVQLFLLALSLCVASTAGAAATLLVPGRRAFPESLSATSGGTLYIGRAGEGGVIRARPGSQSEIWIPPGSFGSRSIFGVMVDERSGTVWICSNDLTAAGIASPGSGRTALKGFDLESGQGKVSAELPGDNPLCNDIAIASDGTVYVTESEGGRVLKLNADRQTFQVWASDPALADIDGIAFGADGNLYVNTFGSGGLFRIAVKGNRADQITKLHTPRPLTGPDGMRVLSGKTFLMIEAGGKLDEITIEGDTVLLKVLKEGLLEPAAVAQIGRTAWVSEAQVSLLFNLKDPKPPVLPFRVVPIPLTTH